MTTPFPFTPGQTLTAAQMNAITTLPINDQTASYVALVGDVGKRIVMNVATANTVTINDSVFATGDTIFIANKGAGASTLTAGAGVTINTAGSLVIAQHGGGTLVATSASVFTFFSGAGNLYGVATGGTSSSITVSGVAFTLLTFTSTGTLTVTKAGLFDVLAVGGGGGSGTSVTTAGGGPGGGGGVQIQTVFLDVNKTVTIGSGGAGDTCGGHSGVGAQSDGVTSVGGGVGFGILSGKEIQAQRGGSGGGGTSNSGAYLRTGSLSLAPGVIGNNGGNGSSTASQGSGGGGGGGATGANASTTTGGNGGTGFDASAFRGEVANTTRVAGGGGGGTSTGNTVGTANGGGGGGSNSGVGTTGTINTGGGAGGGTSSTDAAGSAGGSGIVLIRFKV